MTPTVRRRVRGAAAMWSVAALIAASAAWGAPAGDASPVRAVHAARRPSAVAIDGTMNEPAWQAAAAVGGFWQREPDEGAPPRYATEFRVLYDDDALFVGVPAVDPRPERIRGLPTRRDHRASSRRLCVGGRT